LLDQKPKPPFLELQVGRYGVVLSSVQKDKKKPAPAAASAPGASAAAVLVGAGH